MRIQSGLPIGVAALLFEEATARRGLEERLIAPLGERGYEEVILPILDYFEPYQPLLTDSERDALYRFVDRDGQLLALRGDFTSMLARLLAPRLSREETRDELLGARRSPVAEAGRTPDSLDDSSRGLRLFYRGDVVRFQEARPGRLREHYEIGVELIEEQGTAAQRARSDRELLRLFLEQLVVAGEWADEGALDELPRFRIVLGVAGALDELLLDPPQGLDAATVAGALVRRDRETARRGPASLIEVLERGVPRRLEDLGERSARRVGDLLELAQRLEDDFRGVSEVGVRVTVDLAEYATNTLDETIDPGDRRFHYYDGVVFRAYPETSALPVGRGGRYDRLFQRLDAPVGAVGFSLGLDRLLGLRLPIRSGGQEVKR